MDCAYIRSIELDHYMILFAAGMKVLMSGDQYQINDQVVQNSWNCAYAKFVSEHISDC